MSSIVNHGRSQPPKLITARGLVERYSVTDRTLSRWVETGILPVPLYIRKRRYWNLEAVEEADKARPTTWTDAEPSKTQFGSTARRRRAV